MRRRKNILPYSVFVTLAIYSASCVVFLLYNDTLLLTSKATTMMISGAPVLDSMSHEKHDEYIFIGIKTSETGVHGERLPQIRKTWLKDALASEEIEIKFFTHVQANHTNMIDDSSLMVETKCKSNELACKTGQVFSFYLQHSNASWFCSFDDDNYVNIPRLIQVLHEYEDGPTRGKDVFIGRLTQMKSRSMNSTIRFGTGGAGYCINRNLVVRGSQYYSVLESFRYADDVAVGYVTHQKLGVDITDDPLFHSHLERTVRTRISQADVIDKQVSFGHDNKNLYEFPYVDLPNTPILFPKEEEDPMGFRSLWCYLHRNSMIVKESGECTPTVTHRANEQKKIQ